MHKAHITTFNHPNFGEMVAVTNGSDNINDSRCWMSIEEHPYDDQETMVYKSTIAYLMEENKRLKKQVRKLTRVIWLKLFQHFQNSGHEANGSNQHPSDTNRHL